MTDSQKVQKKYLVSWKDAKTSETKSLVALVLDDDLCNEEHLIEDIRSNLVAEHGLDNVAIEEQPVTEADHAAYLKMMEENKNNNKGE